MLQYCNPVTITTTTTPTMVQLYQNHRYRQVAGADTAADVWSGVGFCVFGNSFLRTEISKHTTHKAGISNKWDAQRERGGGMRRVPGIHTKSF